MLLWLANLDFAGGGGVVAATYIVDSAINRRHRIITTYQRLESLVWPSLAGAGLFVLGSPVAVLGFVVTVAIDTVNRVLPRRTLPHVGKEILEAVQPAFANCYPSTAISAVPAGMGVQAAGLHCLPTTVRRVERGISIPAPMLEPRATATVATTGPKFSTFDETGLPALTNALPDRTSPTTNNSKCLKPSERLTRYVQGTLRLLPFRAEASARFVVAGSKATTSHHDSPAALTATFPRRARSRVSGPPYHSESSDYLSGHINHLHTTSLARMLGA